MGASYTAAAMPAARDPDAAVVHPHLGRHVAARRHLVGDRATVVLVDQRDGRTVRLGEREWAVAAAMDGTRTVEGLVLAAGRRGAATSPARVAEFVLELQTVGFLDDGVPVPAPTVAAPPTPADRALEALPGYRLECDGRGSCCRLYPTVLFLPRDVARARAARPDVFSGGDDEAAAFTPVAGTPDAVSAPALVDGRCAYLEPGDRCGIHAVAGAEAKPFGCRTFPLAFVDDGTTVRVVPRPECACVPRSAAPAGNGAAEGSAGDGAATVLPAGAARRGDLPAQAFVHRVPEQVVLRAATPESTVTAERSALAAWSRALASASTPDAAAAFAALATSIGEGLDVARDLALVTAPPPLDFARVASRIAAVGIAAGRKASEGWRSPRDLAQQCFLALETACELALAAPETFTAGPRHDRERAAEAFHLRAVIFGHLAFLGDTPPVVADELDERAATVICGRALGVVAELAELPDPAFEWPLALVEALVRGHGL